jgi:sorbose reductase
MWTAQAAGKIFKRQGHGSLVITASVSAILVNIPQTQAAYNASKAAVVHLAKSLAVEWASFARVNCISPGFIETESTSSFDQEVELSLTGYSVVFPTKGAV